MHELQVKLGHTFKNIALLEQALAHKSCGPHNNERLEFIGDALLNCEAALLLFENFPAMEEGNMSRVRAGMVRQETLVKIANRLGIARYIQFKTLAPAGIRCATPSESIIADCVEAIYAAVYLDGGLIAAKNVIRRHLVEVLNNHEAMLRKDPKTQLQEFLQARKIKVPSYAILRVEESNQGNRVEVKCVIDQLKITTTAVGATKKVAEAAAAQNALQVLEACEAV